MPQSAPSYYRRSAAHPRTILGLLPRVRSPRHSNYINSAVIDTLSTGATVLSDGVWADEFDALLCGATETGSITFFRVLSVNTLSDRQSGLSGIVGQG